MLGEAGIARSECSLSNVFSQRPPNNDEEYFCVKKKDLPAGYSLPALNSKDALYVAPEYLHNLDRVRDEIRSVKPNIILALGKSALWATCQRTDLGSARGFVLRSTLVPEHKVIATYHPARVLREWSLRIIALADFVKCNRESRSPVIQYDKTQVWINPLIEDLHEWERRFLIPNQIVTCDIETIGKIIRCVGFGASAGSALVVPLYGPMGCYWPTQENLKEAISFIRHVLQTYQIIFQNGAFDVSHFLRAGIVPTGYTHDTMLLHHSLYPELKKSLEFLGSYLANRPAWKKMRPRGNKTGKREE